MKGSDRYSIDGVQCHYDGQPLPVSNLSVGGFFAATDRPPAKGQVLALDLSLQGRDSFRILATVTWINEGGDPKTNNLPQGFGVKITKIAFQDKLAILNVLKQSDPARQRGTMRRI
jgi:hypothetical protein